MKIGTRVHIIGTYNYGRITKIENGTITVNRQIYFRSEIEVQPPCIWCSESSGKVRFGVCETCFNRYYYKSRKVSTLRHSKKYKYLNKDWK